MGWNWDQPPLNYLKRRIVFYKKKRRSVMRLINSKSAEQRFGGKKKLKERVVSSVMAIDDRIKEFEKAVKKLGGKL